MFSFGQEESAGKENKGLAAVKNFFPSAPVQIKNQTVRDTFKFDESALAKIKKYGSCGQEKEGGWLQGPSPVSLSCSTELSSFDLHSDDSMDSTDDDSSLPHHLTPSNVLYKPTFDSPIDRLARATNPATPKRAAMDTFHKLQTWVAIEASADEIKTYSLEIRNRAIPELLEFIRTNVDDKECVLEALVLLETLASMAEKGHAQTSSTISPLLIDAKAINILVEALQYHSNHSTSSTIKKKDAKLRHLKALQAQQMTCLFQRLWSVLMGIVLRPSSSNYFQRCADKERRVQTKKQKQSQRMNLITAVDLCLDRILFSSFSIHTTSTVDHPQCWMDHVFKILTMLLRIKNKEGKSQPNDEMRSVLLEKQIVAKCQKIMADRMDAAAWETFGEFDDDNDDDSSQQQEVDKIKDPEMDQQLSLQALFIFETCLCDREDGLAESMLNGRAVEKFVYRILPIFGHSAAIQSKGCHILNELASKNLDGPAPLTLASDDDSSIGNKEENELKADTDNEDTKRREKASLINLLMTIFQKPCLCHSFQSL